MDDKTIIGLYLNRDQEAIRCTQALYGRRLFSLALRILENDQDAEESVSDTYWQAWNTSRPKSPGISLPIWPKSAGTSLSKSCPGGNTSVPLRGSFLVRLGL